MQQYLLLAVAVAVVVGGYRIAAARCRREPGLRRWFIVGSIAGLAITAALVPWVLAKLDPPWSESPAGIFVYLGKAAVAGSLGLGSLGALIGGIFPGHGDERG